MAGFFYTPPPTNIGGSQPFAPRLGQPQSGPIPQSPPQRGAIALATVGVLLASWATQPQPQQKYARIAPLIPAAAIAKTPVNNSVNLRIIADQWTQAQVVVLPASEIAPLLTAPVTPDVAPLLTGTNLSLVLQQWLPGPNPQQRLPVLTQSGPTLSTQTPYSTVNLNITVASWAPKYVAAQKSAQIAPTLPVVSQPQPLTLTNLQTVIASWVPPFVATQGYVEIAPILPAVIAAQSVPYVDRNTAIVLSQWRPQWYAGKGYGTIASQSPPAPVVSSPPPYSRVNFRVATLQWQPLPYTPVQGWKSDAAWNAGGPVAVVTPPDPASARRRETRVAMRVDRNALPPRYRNNS
jgi:hypothetical protein